MKKARTKKYRPKPASTGGGLTVLAKVYERGEELVPLTGGQLTDLGVAYWLSLEQLRTGDANEEAWSCVACALNIGLVLCELEIGDQYQAEFRAALDGAFRAKVRSAKTGNFRLDGDALREITGALCIHDEQMALATRKEVTAAMRTVHARISEGIIYQLAA